MNRVIIIPTLPERVPIYTPEFPETALCFSSFLKCPHLGNNFCGHLPSERLGKFQKTKQKLNVKSKILFDF